jgi:hypothetical protein
MKVVEEQEKLKDTSFLLDNCEGFEQQLKLLQQETDLFDIPRSNKHGRKRPHTKKYDDLRLEGMK